MLLLLGMLFFQHYAAAQNHTNLQNSSLIYIAPGTNIANAQNINIVSQTDNALYIIGNATISINGASNALVVYMPTSNNASANSLLAKKIVQKQTAIAQLIKKVETDAAAQPTAVIIKAPFSTNNLTAKNLCFCATTTTPSIGQKKYPSTVANFSKFSVSTTANTATSAAINNFITTNNNRIQHFAAYALFSRPPTV
jgi:hypothetical protein